MPFNINNLRSTIENYGYLKTNHFEVYLQPPKMLFGGISAGQKPVNEIAKMQTFRIDQIRAPGISLMMADVNRYGIGPTQKQVFNAQYSDLSFSILCDGKAEIWRFWYNWLNAIYEFNGSEDANFGQVQRIARYSAEYNANYSTQMQIVMYDTAGKTVQRINLGDAFPSSMREMSLAWGEENTLLKINVSISYSGYTIVNADSEIPNPSRSNLT